VTDLPALIMRAAGVTALAIASWGAIAGEPSRGYQPKVPVRQAGRFDWTFVVSNRSLASPPSDWTPDYDPQKEHYALFVPEGCDPQKPCPLILLVPAGDQPDGWAQLEPVCRKQGILFASPYGAGNACPGKQRVRIVLDVLDQVRRDWRVDPDRTYIAGISGGGRMACAIGFALPECFGGVIGICAGGELRSERWLRHRLRERMSVAYVTGDRDFNRAEVQRLRTPVLKALEVRTRVWVAPGMGHAMPSAAILAEVFAWLEEGLAARRELALRWPAIRMPADGPPSREQWAGLLWTEARERLRSPETTFSGLVQLKGVAARWPDLSETAQATALLHKYSDSKNHPWAKSDLDEQRRVRIAEARALGDYATGPLLPPYDAKRKELARAALERWQDILRRNPNAALAEEAADRVGRLERILGSGRP